MFVSFKFTSVVICLYHLPSVKVETVLIFTYSHHLCFAHCLDLDTQYIFVENESNVCLSTLVIECVAIKIAHFSVMLERYF